MWQGVRSANTLPLPDYAHLPGINPRPGGGLLESVAARACTITCDSNADSNIAWQYGVRLINAGFYWEAHDVLEAVWRNAAPNSRERFLVQCIIHIANARLKLALNQPRAVARLTALAVECLQRACPAPCDVVLGLDARLLKQVIAHSADSNYRVSLKIITHNITKK